MQNKQPEKKTLIVECQFFLSQESLTARQAKVIEDNLRAACQELFPDTAIRGLWVHEGINRGFHETG